MKICAIACVKDSHSLLIMSMQHLVLNGIRDFYIYDHGSDPAMSSFLPAQFASGSIRLWILRKETPYFFQREMVSVLTYLAREDGFEVCVGFDADEFWCSTIPGHTLARQIELEMASGADALRVPVINYAQHVEVDDFHRDALAGCQFAMVPHLDPKRHPRDQVEAGIPFIAIPFPSKAIARLSPDIRFAQGQHTIIKTGGRKRIIKAAGIVVRHLPQPSRNHVKEKREQGRRIISGGFSAEMGWQSQSLAAKTDEELGHYWANNSWHWAEGQRAMVGSYDLVTKDDGLVTIGRQLAQFGKNQEGGREGGNGSPMEYREIPVNKLERMIEQLVDDSGRTERKIEKMTLDRDQAEAKDHSPRYWVRDLINLLRPIEKRVRRFRKGHS